MLQRRFVAITPTGAKIEVLRTNIFKCKDSVVLFATICSSDEASDEFEFTTGRHHSSVTQPVITEPCSDGTMRITLKFGPAVTVSTINTHVFYHFVIYPQATTVANARLAQAQRSLELNEGKMKKLEIVTNSLSLLIQVGEAVAEVSFS